jgi:large subunit ribosomal protein L25
MEVFKLKARPRTDLGKKATKAIRKENLVPCILYGGDEIQHFTLVPLELRSLVYSPEFKVVEIDLDGTLHKCFVKDVQFHPVDERIMHIDFLRLVEDHPVKINVPISFEGVAVGIKSGGKLIKKMRKVTIQTTPAHLIDKIVMNTTSLELGQSARIKDLNEYEGVEVLNNENIPVATIEVPRALRAGAEETAAPAAAAATPAAAAKAPAAPAKAAAPAKDAGKKK